MTVDETSGVMVILHVRAYMMVMTNDDNVGIVTMNDPINGRRRKELRIQPYKVHINML